MTATEDETNWLPFTVRRTPCCTWTNVMLLGESELMIGVGRLLPPQRIQCVAPWEKQQR
jgi:hypothetical protein